MKWSLLICVTMLLVANNVVAQGKANSAQWGWLADYKAARAEAKQTGKPILLVLRCEPCEDFAKIDEQLLKRNKAIAAHADKFVRVRLTRITGIDLRLFEFDFDLPWVVFFLNADETIYGRYGGRDIKGPNERVSLEGLRYAMEGALETHQKPPESSPRQPALKAEEYAGAKRVRGCIHCHNVNEFRRADLKLQGKWSRELLWAYPPPENIGIALDVDRGNLVKSIANGGPAAKAGIKAGDIVHGINGYSVHSFADAAFALHRAPPQGVISVDGLRDGKPFFAKLEVGEGWRKTDYTWRPSLLDILPTLPLSGADLSSAEKTSQGLPLKRLAIRQDKFVHSTLKEAGLQKDDVIVGINGVMMDGTMEEFLGHVRREFLVGDKVILNVRRDGKPAEAALTLK